MHILEGEENNYTMEHEIEYLITCVKILSYLESVMLIVTKSKAESLGCVPFIFNTIIC